METKNFEYNGKVVGFEIDNSNVMVNATEMASVFGKEPTHFIRNENTKSLIEAFCQTANSQFEDEFSPSGKFVKIIKGGRGSGTWLDRRVAIAFAMWLNPLFSVWVCNTIDNILFGTYLDDEKNLKAIARIQTRIAQKEQLLTSHPLRQEIEELRRAEQKEKKMLELRKKARISNFKSMFSVEEMAGEPESPTEQ
ncbi:hypothetical protein IX307_001149 [Bacteroides pyogenes]|uniref:KilA-N domain-containing protein n=1 Tax=Bacteroides pyogenes TaxID=310300 RepID=UPI001BA92933|nr:KilA-N domain-containing protein [Bacteroides pyogenes]MBR8719964.1 hypothetical protein [Bacteroides pyogenes]MBR8786835.1 hypothetical protein [Bacteroides pyogenes]MBR8792320.1 hypothetical protein [Bacteroides pyogenes]